MTLINLVSEKTLEVVSPSASEHSILAASIAAIKAYQKSQGAILKENPATAIAPGVAAYNVSDVRTEPKVRRVDTLAQNGYSDLTTPEARRNARQVALIAIT